MALEMDDASTADNNNNNQADDNQLLAVVNDSDDFLDKIAENEDEEEDDVTAFLQLDSDNEALLQTKLIHYDLAVRDTVSCCSQQ